MTKMQPKKSPIPNVNMNWLYDSCTTKTHCSLYDVGSFREYKRLESPQAIFFRLY